MEPEEFVNPNNTAYKYNECLIEDDLVMFLEHLLMEKRVIPRELIEEHMGIDMAINTVDTLIEWLRAKKPRDFGGMI